MSTDNHGPTDTDLRRAILGCLGTLCIAAVGLLGIWIALVIAFAG